MRRLLGQTLALMAILAAAPCWSPARMAPERPPPPASAAPDAEDVVATSGRIPIRIFTDVDGLPQNGITAVTFDSSGYLWIGTKDGAAYYNGRRWHPVRFPERSRSNWVQCILVASDSSVWFGTTDGIVVKRGDGWDVYDTSSGLPDKNVTSLLERRNPDGAYSVLAGTSSWAARWRDGAWEPVRPPGIASNVGVKCMLEVVDDGATSLWMGLDGEGTVCLRDGEWTFYSKLTGLPDNRVYSLIVTTAFDGRPTLVAGTFGAGLARFDGNRWVPIPRQEGIPGEFISCMTESMEVDGSHTLWVGSLAGIARFNAGRWSNYGIASGLPIDSAWSLLADGSPFGTHTMWIGTAGAGLVRWDQGRWISYDTSNGLQQNSTYSLLETTLEDGSPAIWVGSLTKGIARFARGEWTYFDKGRNFPASSGLCLAETASRDGTRWVWVGTNYDGLVRIGRDGSTRVFGDPHIPNLFIHSLLPSPRADGREALYVGTASGLALFVDGAPSTVDPAIQLPNDDIRCMLETTARDGARTLWIGTDAGLVRYERGQLVRYDTESGFPNNHIMSIAEIPLLAGGREVWVGTRGGLVRIDPDSDRPWTMLSTSSEPALPNNTIYRIMRDANGRIYLCTNKGVARLTPHEPIPDLSSLFDVYVFRTEDGLPSNECNTGASMVDRRGRLWVGTISGVGMFDPSTEVEAPLQRRLHVERVRVVDEDRTLQDGDRLGYDEDHLLFEYALLSYFREGDSRYRTQLAGFDPGPSPWSADNKKEYTALPPGQYTFRVWGRDAFGTVVGPVETSFEIFPAPWRTWWAYLLYACGLLGLGYAGTRVRVRALRRRNEQLEFGIQARTAELDHKVEELRESEQRALESKNAAVLSERRARESEREALQASRAKSVFLANMSHELRTPLNAILGFVQLMLRDHDLKSEQRENLGIVMRSGEHLLSLINDVLSLSKIEAGRVLLAEHAFDLHRMLSGLEELFRLRAEAKRLRLIFDVAQTVPRFVWGDESKLRQVLINLLGNAVKFTTEGSVALHVEWGDDRAVFTVEDSGPGIAADEMEKLFKAFVQTQSGEQTMEGTGLGLVISRNYVALMDGDITVHSEPGAGTIFRVELTLPATDEIEARSDLRRVIGLEPDQARHLILVVDDMTENRTLLARLLTSVGFQVREAANGAEAVDEWRRWSPDLILMDLRMPVMNGVEATREIRRLEREASPEADDGTAFNGTPIVALTASAFEHDRSEAAEAGCDAYIPKPFREEDVFAALNERLGVRFVYDRPEFEPASAAEEVARQPLTPERLMGVPPELRARLGKAATLGDVGEAAEVIDEIGRLDDALAEDLRGLMRRYSFDDILDLVEGSARR